MDGNYQAYVNRVVPLTIPTNYEQQLQHIQSSPKFSQGKPVKFPGFSVITPPWVESKINGDLYQQLTKMQTQLVEKLGDKLFIAIPPSTFHLTIVDLIWEKAYTSAVKQNANFEQLLITEIAKIFEQYQSSLREVQSLELEVLGLSIFPRAIAVCLVPTEESYNHIIELRSLIYQAGKIIKLGVEQQYDFVAHITLGYFGEISPDLDLHSLKTNLSEINDQWLEESPPLFQIKKMELRKFNDMTSYVREPDWATINLEK